MDTARKLNIIDLESTNFQKTFMDIQEYFPDVSDIAIEDNFSTGSTINTIVTLLGSEREIDNAIHEMSNTGRFVVQGVT